jgi:hypothetical protein
MLAVPGETVIDVREDGDVTVPPQPVVASATASKKGRQNVWNRSRRRKQGRIGWPHRIKTRQVEWHCSAETALPLQGGSNNGPRDLHYSSCLQVNLDQHSISCIVVLIGLSGIFLCYARKGCIPTWSRMNWVVCGYSHSAIEYGLVWMRLVVVLLPEFKTSYLFSRETSIARRKSCMMTLTIHKWLVAYGLEQRVRLKRLKG